MIASSAGLARCCPVVIAEAGTRVASVAAGCGEVQLWPSGNRFSPSSRSGPTVRVILTHHVDLAIKRVLAAILGCRASQGKASGSVGKAEIPDTPIADPETGGETIKLLGTIEVTTNQRVTVPKRLKSALDVHDGDFLLFYEDGGKVVVKSEKGYVDPRKAKKKAEKG